MVNNHNNDILHKYCENKLIGSSGGVIVSYLFHITNGEFQFYPHYTFNNDQYPNLEELTG